MQPSSVYCWFFINCCCVFVHGECEIFKRENTLHNKWMRSVKDFNQFRILPVIILWDSRRFLQSSSGQTWV